MLVMGKKTAKSSLFHQLDPVVISKRMSLMQCLRRHYRACAVIALSALHSARVLRPSFVRNTLRMCVRFRANSLFSG
jgi:hypothetical protein